MSDSGDDERARSRRPRAGPEVVSLRVMMLLLLLAGLAIAREGYRERRALDGARFVERHGEVDRFFRRSSRDGHFRVFRLSGHEEWWRVPDLDALPPVPARASVLRPATVPPRPFGIPARYHRAWGLRAGGVEYLSFEEARAEWRRANAGLIGLGLLLALGGGYFARVTFRVAPPPDEDD